jgi:WW domain-containing oxidoreductase
MFRRRPTADAVLEGIDLAGRVFLVTGGDSGIGFETARALAARGARTYLGCLRRETGDAAAARIVAAHAGADVRPIEFDLGDLAAVEAAAAALPDEALHGVVCNAGVYGGPYATTKDGFERTLGVCYVGHAALVHALRSRLEAGAPSRVVMVSSENHRWPRELEFDGLPVPRERYTELRAYGQAKLCCVLFANALDARWAPRGVRGFSLHPGDLVATAIDKDSWVLRTVLFLARPFSPSASQAAATSVWAATSPALEGRGGIYLADVREKPPAPAAMDRATQDRLWELTEGWIAARRP